MNQAADKTPLESFKRVLPVDAANLAHELWQDICALQSTWACFLKLFADSQATIELMNESGRPFFHLIQQLIQHEIYLGIARLTDPANTRGRVNISLAALIEQIRLNGHEEAAEKLTRRLTQLMERVEPIREQRNRILAHSDLQDTLTLRNEGLPGVAKAELDEIIEEISGMFNEVEQAIGKPVTYFTAARSHSRPEDILFRLEQAKIKIDAERPY